MLVFHFVLFGDEVQMLAALVVIDTVDDVSKQDSQHQDQEDEQQHCDSDSCNCNKRSFPLVFNIVFNTIA